MDRKFIPKEEALTPIFSQSVQYGAGVFEGIRFYKTKDGRRAIFRLAEHLSRFRYSANAMSIDFPFSEEEIASAAIETIKANGLEEGYIRPWVGFTGEKIGLDVNESKFSCFIGVFNWPAYYSGPLNVKISRIIRPHPSSFPMAAKISGTYVNSIIAKMNAKRTGHHEALLLDHEGNIGEASASNIFMVGKNSGTRKKTLLVPASFSILNGITRDTVKKLAAKIKPRLEIFESTFKAAGYLGHLRSSGIKEFFLCGTAAEITPVVSINGNKIGTGKPGPVTQKLQKLYGQAVRAELPGYEHWLTYVDVD